MSKKQEFINYVKELIDATSEYPILMNEEARLYWEAFCGTPEAEKPMFTDNGKLILKWMQENTQEPMLRAKDIAEGLFIGSRAVSGAMRKLVDDGFVEKLGQNPVIYSITEKGKEIKIED
jgi:predicted transcriptional regulator